MRKLVCMGILSFAMMFGVSSVHASPRQNPATPATLETTGIPGGYVKVLEWYDDQHVLLYQSEEIHGPMTQEELDQLSMQIFKEKVIPIYKSKITS